MPIESQCPTCGVLFPVPPMVHVNCAHGGGASDRVVVQTVPVDKAQGALFKRNITHTREDY